LKKDGLERDCQVEELRHTLQKVASQPKMIRCQHSALDGTDLEGELARSRASVESRDLYSEMQTHSMMHIRHFVARNRRKHAVRRVYNKLINCSKIQTWHVGDTVLWPTQRKSLRVEECVLLSEADEDMLSFHSARSDVTTTAMV